MTLTFKTSIRILVATLGLMASTLTAFADAVERQAARS